MVTGEMLRSGLREAPPTPVRLTAGPLSAEFAGGEVRNVRVVGEEVARRVYVAVRDRDWGTVPLALSDLHIEQHADGFRVTFTATHRADTPEPIHFAWRGAITGAADGTLTCAMDGAAVVPFQRNRIGWCVLHPPKACAGQPCTVAHPDGTTTTTAFPVQIAPHQPFLAIAAMAHPTPRGTRVAFAFDGDVFETEDQRNWTDDSYKTYGTPLSLPYPVRVAAGEAVRQSVMLSVEQSAASSQQPAEDSAGVTITVGARQVAIIPPLGLGAATGEPLTPHERQLLGVLVGITLHRIDLSPTAADAGAWRDVWRSNAALGWQMIVALHLPGDLGAAQAALNALADEYARTPAPVPMWLIFDASGQSPPAHLTLARDTLLPLFPTKAPQLPRTHIGGGTDAYFTHLNRERPPEESLDFVSFSINPQVHAFDNRSIAETLAGQTAVVESARALYSGLPVHVSPVTLRPRHNPDGSVAPAEAAPLPPGTLPPQIDTRQLSLFAAGWTAMSVKHLAEAGASAITYYETVGPCGVMERESGSPYGDAFPSEPGQVYPLYHALADIGEMHGASVLPTTSNDALRADALVMQGSNYLNGMKDLRVLVANLHDAPETVTVRLPGRHAAATVRLLDEAAAPAALRDPIEWRATAAIPLTLTDDGTAFTLTLPPYAYACVNVRKG